MARLAVEQISEAGPLYRRGFARVTSLRRSAGNQAVPLASEATAPREILARLGDLTSDVQVFFEYTRGNRLPKSFQLISAWQAVATLFASDAGEWAFWTPEGYYDASANGHTLFGWQVNHGQIGFRSSFVPINSARRSSDRKCYGNSCRPEQSTKRFAAWLLRCPQNRRYALLQADRRCSEGGNSLSASGEVLRRACDEGASTSPDPIGWRNPAFARVCQRSGFRGAAHRRRARYLEAEDNDEARAHEITYEWDVALPRGSRQMIQVFVGTAAKTAAFEQVLVQLPAQTTPLRRNGLSCTSLRSASESMPTQRSNRSTMRSPMPDRSSRSLQRGAGGLYEVVEPVLLKNEEVTRSNWTETFAKFAHHLREQARPDDLLVIFFAGHGEVDERTQTYHFICHDARAAHCSMVPRRFPGMTSSYWQISPAVNWPSWTPAIAGPSRVSGKKPNWRSATFKKTSSSPWQPRRGTKARLKLRTGATAHSPSRCSTVLGGARMIRLTAWSRSTNW